MELTRRNFLGTSLIAGTARIGAAPYFGLHPFIEQNPGAVFVQHVNVATRFDSSAFRNEGLHLARQIFVSMDRPGIPVDHRIVLKPNMIYAGRSGAYEDWGVNPYYYEGLLLGLKERGLQKFFVAEGNYWYIRPSVPFDDIHERYGVEVAEPEHRPRDFGAGNRMTWSKVPEAVVYQRIPHLAPVNEPGTWLLNISKMRPHGMCLSQAVKNLQGLTVRPFVQYCSGWPGVTGVPDFMKPGIHPQAVEKVTKYFESHRRMGYSRYDSKARLGPIEQEIWAHKTCDNHSVVKPGLSLIEAIHGPREDGTGDWHSGRMVLFGKQPFRVDIVGLWLGGHEPGNIHLYRIAKERGLTDTFNPWEVPVYEWTESGPVRRKLTDFSRLYLKTYYLQKDGEPRYHLVDEPFDYDRAKL